jgi:antirestriction protein ArdC
VHNDAGGEDREQAFRFLKTYTIFNVAQIDGLPERFHAAPEPAPEAERIEAAEAFFAFIPAIVNHGGDKAYYMPSADRIQLPPMDTTLLEAMRPATGLGTRAALIAALAARNGVAKATHARNL